LARVAAIELNITRVSLQARHAMLSRNPQELQATLEDIGAKRKLIDAAIEGFNANVKSPRGKELFAAAQGRIGDFWKEGGANLEMTAAGRKDEAFAHLVGTLIPARERLLASIVELREYQETLLANLVESSQQDTRNVKLVLVAMIGTVSVALVCVGWVLTAALKRRVAQASSAAQAIAAGDLSQTVVANGHDEFRPLFEQMALMQQSLHQVVGQVRMSTDSISTASSEIATGNQDLSSRTEQTASNLQQAAASMGQLTDTVKQSAEAARQANQLASSAAQVAARGGSVVSQVVATMDEINQSSRKIADITGVIGTAVLTGTSTPTVQITDVSTAQGALDSIDEAIVAVNSQRAEFGAVQNRFENVISNLMVSAENQTAARGRIMDADYASETANLSRASILQQAGNAMVAQANQLPQQVLALLR
jgi:methyl-accepting chemotaxis protein